MATLAMKMSGRSAAKPGSRLQIMAWHRRLSLVLAVQLFVWLTTALGMALIPSSSLTGYVETTPPAYDAAASWPETSALSDLAPGAARVTLAPGRASASLTIADADGSVSEVLVPETLSSREPISAIEAAQIIADFTGEDISVDDVSLQTEYSSEYSYKANLTTHPLPAWRVDAEKATIFVDQSSGEIAAQTTPAQRFENILKSLHAMDYSFTGNFRSGLLLTVFAAIFLATAMLGILPIRRIYAAKRQGVRALRWHQLIGIVFCIQVVFWATSGLAVTWLMTPFERAAAAQQVAQDAPIEFDRIAFSPSEVLDDGQSGPTRISLTMLLGEPVYQLAWEKVDAPKSFMSPVTRQALYSAVDGRQITLDSADREAIAKKALDPETFASLGEWSTLDYAGHHEFLGPLPVWQASFSEPRPGTISIDAVSGRIQTPLANRRQSWNSAYYKTHLMKPLPGPHSYRFEPVLIVGILVMLGLLFMGLALHLRRRRNAKRMSSR